MAEGVTPLRMAVDRGLVRIARFLVDAGADPRAADENGNTPLSRAQAIGPSALAKRLAAIKRSRTPAVAPDPRPKAADAR
jgi:ankyrin repeat protein